MKFTINRSTWRAGGESQASCGIGATSLLNLDGFMCCLGQIMSQLGVPLDILLSCGTPHIALGSDTRYARYSQASALLCIEDPLLDPRGHWSDHTSLAKAAMAINDDESKSSMAEREAALIALFNEHGHEIEFTGEYFRQTLAVKGE